MFPNTSEIRTLLASALQEDSAKSDLTSKLLIQPRWTVDAYIVAKQNGVICGLPFAEKIFKSFDRSLRFESLVRDGARVRSGTRLARVRGCARSVLSAERPSLNAIQHLSGISTLTHALCQKLRGTHTRLYDTRKTLPGWRALQKYAVRCGGGVNHRMSLGAAILIKENHLKIARAADSQWRQALEKRLKTLRGSPVQIEVQSARDLRDVLVLKPARVLLDNFTPQELRPMIRTLRHQIPGIEIELSGGITPADLSQYARLGADRISMGSLTHSVKAFDCSLDITHVRS